MLPLSHISLPSEGGIPITIPVAFPSLCHPQHAQVALGHLLAVSSETDHSVIATDIGYKTTLSKQAYFIPTVKALQRKTLETIKRTPYVHANQLTRVHPHSPMGSGRSSFLIPYFWDIAMFTSSAEVQLRTRPQSDEAPVGQVLPILF